MEISIARKFGLVLKAARAEVGLSQQSLALEVELDRTYISLLERGLRQPTLSTVFSLAKPLKVSPNELVKRTEELRVEL